MLGGGSVKTQCHPDGSAKVTGGTTGAGATSAVAVSSGMTFADGTAESKVTLAMAKVLKTKLLNAGYDVLMIRESDDVQLDNIARTVIANNKMCIRDRSIQQRQTAIRTMTMQTFPMIMDLTTKNNR